MRYLITGAEEPFISSDSPLRILILPQYCAVSYIYIYTAGVTPCLLYRDKFHFEFDL